MRATVPRFSTNQPVDARVTNLEQRLAAVEGRLTSLEHTNTATKAELYEQIEGLQAWANENHEKLEKLEEEHQITEAQLAYVLSQHDEGEPPAGDCRSQA